MKHIPDEKYTVQTSVGHFRIEKMTNLHPYSGAYQYEILRVGGKKFCIFIKFNRNTPREAELQWLITNEGGCELTGKEIRGSATQHLLYLTITILRTIIPTVRVLKLLDNSKIPCVVSVNNSQTVYLDKYYFMLYGSTWYERMFSAFPMGEVTRNTYKQKQEKYTDPKYKPQTFDFRNHDLDKLLSPIFATSSTWAEFGQRMSETYSPACSYLYPWYLHAVASIMDNEAFPEHWGIDATKTPAIAYKRLTNGGRRRNHTTKKVTNYKDINKNSEHNNIQMSPDDIYNIKYI